MLACTLLTLLPPLLLPAQEPVAEPAEAPTPRLAAWNQRERMRAQSSSQGLVWQALGPKFCGGRIEAVDCPAGDPATIYAGIGAGGVFRSRNGGLGWEPIFDTESTFAVGDVEISPADRNVIWVGTGEAHLSGSSYPGTGVFKSTDAGDSWTNTGLQSSGHIGKVVAHPSDVECVFVAAMGPMRGTGEQGIYRSLDGGASWERVLHCGDGVALVDLVMDPSDPERLWATAWRRGGQQASGVFRSSDGGDSWTRLEGGLLTGDQVGRVAIAASASEPGVLYCLMVDHSPEGGGRSGVGGVLLRSDDAGDSWTRTHEDYLPTYVGWDFCDVRVAPDDAKRVYVCGFRLLVSKDAGASFERGGEQIQRLHPHAGTGMHLDMHDLWIDPEQPERLLLGNDGGLYTSWDRGETWLHLNELPIAEFYSVHLEDIAPGEPGSAAEGGFRIWGGTQDNASLVRDGVAALVPGEADPWSHVFLDPWAGGDGFSTFPDPFDASLVYFAQQLGDLKRGRRGELRGARRIRPAGKDLRFAWNTPFRASPHAEGVLYCAGETVFRSTDRGDSWASLGPAGVRGTITALDESPRNGARLVLGAGGGQLQTSADGGVTWTLGGALPRQAVREVLASCHDEKRLYVALSGAASGDRGAYLLRSEDFGASWSSLAQGLPAEPINALAEHPENADTLYIGTDLGVWASADAGATWEVLGAGLPTTPVVDMAFHGPTETLVIVTHGRGAFALRL